MKNKLLWIFITLLMVSNITISYANQNNFQFAPPPLPWPTFEEGRQDMRLGLTYLKAEMGAFTLSGGGFDLRTRSVLHPMFAMGGQVPFYMFFGDMYIGGSKVKTSNMSFSPVLHLESQVLKYDRYSLIIFAGVGINMMSSFFTIPATQYTSAMTGSVMAFSWFTPVGLQMGIDLPLFTIAPFATITLNHGGSASTSMGSYSTSTTIESYKTTSFGTDIIYRPWDMSLGTLWQEAAGSRSGEQDVKTLLIQLSWRWEAHPTESKSTIFQPKRREEPEETQEEVEEKTKEEIEDKEDDDNESSNQ